MIEKIKANLEFSELWWNSAKEDEIIAQDEIDCVKELNAAIRYLIGEVERLQHERDNALSLRNISVKHYNTVKEENDMLRRELAEYREEEEPGPRFKMDAQGNLTLIEEE